MTAPDPTDGLLVITMINRLTGEAGSEVYEVVAANSEDDALLVRDGSGPGHRWYEVVQRPVTRPVGVESGLLTPDQRVQAAAEFAGRKSSPSAEELVERYRSLILAMIEADEPCPAYSCAVTFLGHLLAGCTPEQVAMVKALDPSQATP